MRTRRAGALLLIVALGAWLGACASAQRAATPDAGADAAINRVLDDFHDAAASADFDRYFGHFAKDAVFLGTDASERWTRDEFMAYARPYFKPGGGWTYHPRGRRISFTPDGRTAFFDELLDNAGLGETRGSGVLVREAGEWKVAQYNLSIPIPNPLADSVVHIVRGRPR